MIENITEATPVEIDTEIARLYGVRKTHQAAAERHWKMVEHHVGQVLDKNWRNKVTTEEIRSFLAEYSEVSESEEMQREAYGVRRSYAQQAWEYYGKYTDAETDADECLMDIEPLNDEWVRRGRWNRAFLVTNAQGHVHSSMRCSTCRETTEYYWVTDLSDHDEDEIVKQAGERACTVCYPTAPVEYLMSSTRIFSPAEKDAQQAREERAAKKVEREAAMVTLDLWVASRNYRTKEVVLDRKPITWKTTRALQNDAGALVRVLEGCWSMVNGFETHYLEDPQLRFNLQAMLEALSERGVDIDTLVKKNTARAIKER